jgi:hypothetical protein
LLIHGKDEILHLATLCKSVDRQSIEEWHVDECHFSEIHVASLRDAYLAVLKGGVDSQIVAELRKLGVPIDELLVADDDARDLVTRSDAIEIAAIATLIELDDWPTDTLVAPNIPKMSRKKSDSGIDAIAVTLDPESSRSAPIADHEVLFLCSVKHTLVETTDALRRDLLKSASTSELTAAYLAAQLRVFKGRLESEGMRDASRVFLFIADFPNSPNVHIHAVAAVDAEKRADFRDQLERFLTTAPSESFHLRTILIASIATLHSRLMS